MIGRFPWDPFPQGEPDPKGPDPLHAALYRAAVAGADAYRAVRQVLRIEHGVLRVGNRFVSAGRFRQVGFVAAGHAAASTALAALDALGERLTQGFVAGPDAPPKYLPFRSALLPDGWGPAPAAPRTLEAAREIALGLREDDLLLVLVSPGASRAFLAPTPSLSGEELGRLLATAHAQGASAPEIDALARSVGGGGVGGRLLPTETVCEVQTLVVDRGGGVARTGGGPTVALSGPERDLARSALERAGGARETGVTLAGPAAPAPPSPLRAATGRRPVIVAGPSDALRAAADLAFDKGWSSRVGDLALIGDPEATRTRTSERVEELLPEARRLGPGRTKGLVVVSMATLDLPDGAPEEESCRRFLELARAALHRREMSVGLYRTAGPLGADPSKPDPRFFAGGVVGWPTDPGSEALRSQVRALRMRPGITDVGFVVAAVVPAEGPLPSRST